MNYVESLNLFGVPVKEVPCITGSGKPTDSTEGAVGCFYMDTDTGDIYNVAQSQCCSYILDYVF